MSVRSGRSDRGAAQRCCDSCCSRWAAAARSAPTRAAVTPTRRVRRRLGDPDRRPVLRPGRPRPGRRRARHAGGQGAHAGRQRQVGEEFEGPDEEAAPSTSVANLCVFGSGTSQFLVSVQPDAPPATSRSRSTSSRPGRQGLVRDVQGQRRRPSFGDPAGVVHVRVRPAGEAGPRRRDRAGRRQQVLLRRGAEHRGRSRLPRDDRGRLPGHPGGARRLVVTGG